MFFESLDEFSLLLARNEDIVGCYTCLTRITAFAEKGTFGSERDIDVTVDDDRRFTTEFE